MAYELGRESEFVEAVDTIFGPNVAYQATIGDHGKQLFIDR
jgi:hypothetical protein